jgi:ankyrin repeat protein
MINRVFGSGILAVCLASCHLIPRFTSGLSGRKPLHDAAAHGDKVRLEEILNSNGEPVDIRDPDGNTPLHVAADRDQAEAIRFLLSHGANINATNKLGMTPLMLAAKTGSLDAVKVLLKKGADTKRRDVRNRTATDWARANGHYSIAVKIEAASFRGRKSNVIQ